MITIYYNILNNIWKLMILKKMFKKFSPKMASTHDLVNMTINE